MLEVRTRKYFFDDILIYRALCAHGTISIILLLSVCKVANGRVDEHITGASKRKVSIRVASTIGASMLTCVKVIATFHIALGQDGEVGYAPDILHRAIQ